MSLLNDALKAAEQRQNRPQVSSAYTGQAEGQSPSRSKLPLVLVLLVLVTALAAAGGTWWWLGGLSASETPEQLAPATEKPSEPPVPEPEQIVAELSMPVAEPEPEPEPEPIIPVAEVIEPEDSAPDPTGPEPESSPANSAPAAGDTTPKTPASTVKQQRETPEAIDRRTSRELERLLASGRTTEAEQRLTAITANQPAPESREVFAREMLIQKMPARALQWLPQDLTRDHASLRMLRARAQLEQGDLNLAVNTLNSQVPPVADNVEYRITLATLLQQTGETEASAGHWSELIEYDNNQPAWWLGLAMALDAGGRTNSAVRAYTQAATMPGLSDNLVNYARQRLQALQAGS